jgi:hypothetical protein
MAFITLFSSLSLGSAFHDLNFFRRKIDVAIDFRLITMYFAVSESGVLCLAHNDYAIPLVRDAIIVLSEKAELVVTV